MQALLQTVGLAAADADKYPHGFSGGQRSAIARALALEPRLLIEFQLTAEPLTLYACHCTDCQRRSGGALLLSMWVHRGALEVLKGTPRLVTSIVNDTRERRNMVCPTCEIRLWSEPVNRPRHAILRPGVLHQAKDFQPIAHQFVRSALPWLVFPPGVAQYETAPEDTMEYVRLWQEARRTPLRYGEP